MTDLTYDPEFPWVVTNIQGSIISRAVNEFVANQIHKAMDKYGQVIDTTPKPKIPEDAEFVYVELKDGPYYVRKRADGSWVDQTSSQFTSTDHLIRFLNGEGDAEVTVLVRKEES